VEESVCVCDTHEREDYKVNMWGGACVTPMCVHVRVAETTDCTCEGSVPVCECMCPPCGGRDPEWLGFCLT
jgi:hypothetical protein